MVRKDHSEGALIDASSDVLTSGENVTNGEGEESPRKKQRTDADGGIAANANADAAANGTTAGGKTWKERKEIGRAHV